MKIQENLKTSDFDYNLPENLIAQSPLKNREECAMMYINKEKKVIKHLHFFDIINLLNKNDILVLNDTKVYPARLLAKRATGAEVEIFLLNPLDNKNHWEALTKNAKRVKIGEILEIAHDFKVKLINKQDSKENEIPKYEVELIFEGNDIFKTLNQYGSIPLPPYINRKTTKDDKTDYQTVFAKNTGSAACPTAGLHFTKELLEKIKQKGIKIAYVTLNVGLGTFMPVKCEEIKDHTMHFETFTIPFETQKIFDENNSQNTKGKIIAVGTTVLRCLESVYQKHGKIIATTDKTNIFIYPPYKIKSIDKLITNFHLPKSTLLMLVSAFMGREFTLEAYREAIEKNYRFFSYGDCMFIE